MKSRDEDVARCTCGAWRYAGRGCSTCHALEGRDG